MSLKMDYQVVIKPIVPLPTLTDSDKTAGITCLVYELTLDGEAIRGLSSTHCTLCAHLSFTLYSSRSEVVMPPILLVAYQPGILHLMDVVTHVHEQLGYTVPVYRF